MHCKVLTHHGRQNDKLPCLKILASKCLTLGNKLCYMGESRVLRLQVELKFLVNYLRISGQTQCSIVSIGERANVVYEEKLNVQSLPVRKF